MRKIFLLYHICDIPLMTLEQVYQTRQRFIDWTVKQVGIYFTYDFYGCENEVIYHLGIIVDELEELDQLPRTAIPRNNTLCIVGECIDLTQLADNEIDRETFYSIVLPKNIKDDIQTIADCAGTDDITEEDYCDLRDALERLRSRGIIKNFS